MWQITALVAAIAIVAADTGAGQPPGDAGRTVTAAGWQTYTDPAFDFAIDFPPDYVLLPDAGGSDMPRPGVVRRLRFQERDIASGRFVDREPARFAIDVFDHESGQTLRDWLRAAGRLPQGAAVTPAGIAGAGESLRVQLGQQLAPNEFVSLTRGRRVYLLTPFGAPGQQMLATFRLIAPPR
jgi:hypothetical protein